MPVVHPLGIHYILEFVECQSHTLLQNVAGIDSLMVEAANRGNATVVSHHFHQFDPWGVSGVVILEESHLTIHTWPEKNYAAIDVFFCDPDVNYTALRTYLESQLLPKRVLENKLERGTTAQLEIVA